MPCRMTEVQCQPGQNISETPISTKQAGYDGVYLRSQLKKRCRKWDIFHLQVALANSTRSYPNIIKAKREVWSLAQVAEHLPGKGKALSSNPSTTHKKWKQRPK
jgi:hypothetical protein